MALVDHPHISMFGSTECTCTEEEARALAVVAAYRVAKVSERGPFLAPGFKRHRAGFTHIGDLWEQRRAEGDGRRLDAGSSEHPSRSDCQERQGLGDISGGRAPTPDRCTGSRPRVAT